MSNIILLIAAIIIIAIIGQTIKQQNRYIIKREEREQKD